MLRHVSGIHKFYRYSGLDSLSSLQAAIEDARPDLVIPCDDRVVWQLHELYESRPQLRPIMEASLGSGSEYGTVKSRERLLELAQTLSIRVPETRRIHSEEDMHTWFSRASSFAVLKRDGTWGGYGVEIVRSAQQGIDAFHRLAQPLNPGTACKRLLINREPLAIWAWRKRTDPIVTIQQFVRGRPANAMLACWQGELLGLLSVEVLSSQGVTGAANVIHFIDHPEISRAAKLLTERLKLSGFYGLDFMIEQSTGYAWLIEMNPRCTQLGHLSRPGQGDLAGLLYAKLTGQANPEPQFPIEEDIVAFFPQAIDWNTHSEYLRSGYHDVPWEQPELVRELLQKPWPERQWTWRLYHLFRKQQALAASELETVDSAAETDQSLGSKTISS